MLQHQGEHLRPHCIHVAPCWPRLPKGLRGFSMKRNAARWRWRIPNWLWSFSIHGAFLGIYIKRFPVLQLFRVCSLLNLQAHFHHMKFTHTCALFGTLSSNSQNQYHHIPGRVSLFTFTLLIVSDAVCIIGSCQQSRELLEAYASNIWSVYGKQQLNLLPRAVGNCLNSWLGH